MSDLAAAREAWEAFVAVDTEHIGGLPRNWDSDVEYVEDPRWPGAGAFRGHEAVTQRFREYGELLGRDVELRLEDVRRGPSGLVSLVRIRGMSASDLPYDHLWAYRFRMRDGKIVWFRAYLDPDEALAGDED